jgi:hypothetical protein
MPRERLSCPATDFRSYFAGPVCLAADQQMGTWKLNETKSKATPGMGKVTMVTYQKTWEM